MPSSLPPSATEELDAGAAARMRAAGKARRTFHRHMLRFDERVCRYLRFPPSYDLPDNETGSKMRDFLERLASGRVRAYYENGLQVPRSLFHSRIAVLLLSQEAHTRAIVSTPYFFSSRLEIVVKGRDLKGPWGGLFRIGL